MLKSFSLLSQLALGWILSESDFGLYALAISIASLANTLQDGGIRQFLVQKHQKFTDYIKASLFYSFTIRLISAAALVSVAPFAADFFAEDGIKPILWILAASFILSAPAVIYIAKLQTDLRFKRLAKLNSISGAIHHSSMIAFAFMGLGPISFVLPTLITPIYVLIALRLSTGPINLKTNSIQGAAKELLHTSKWLVSCILLRTVIQKGDYLIIGKIFGTATLGVYFFGYEIVASFAMLITTSASSVLLPTFSGLSADPERQAIAFLKCIKKIAIAAPLFAIGLYTVSPFAIELLWKDRWLSSIPIAQTFALSYALSLFTPVSASLLESNALWRLRTTILAAMAVTSIAAAAVGCMLGGIFTVTVCITIHRSVFGLVHLLICLRFLKLPFVQFLPSLVVPLLSCTVICTTVALLVRAFDTHPLILQAIVGTSALLLLSAPLIAALCNVRYLALSWVDFRQIGGRK